MHWQTSQYILLLFFAAIVALIWAGYVWQRIRSTRSHPYAAPFLVLCLAVAIWSGLYGVQVASHSLETKLIAYYLLHIGGALVPPAWIIFAASYTGTDSWITRSSIAGLLVIPLILLLALPTNPFSIALLDVGTQTHGSMVILVTEPGPLYYLFLAYSYTLLVIGTGMILYHALRSSTTVKRQSSLLAVGALVPLILNVFHVLELPPIADVAVNVTPLSLALSVVLFGAALYWYRLLDLRPIARDVVLRQMDDGVVVLDEHERIVDYNPAAERHLLDPVERGSLGSEVIPEYDRLKADGSTEIAITEDAPPESDSSTPDRVLQCSRIPLQDHSDPFGWMIFIRDVTLVETQKRELQEKNRTLEQQKTELEHQKRRLTAQTTELEEQTERLDSFIRGIAHDLRNPLSVLVGLLEEAERSGDEEYFEEIRATISEMDTFLDDLLYLSQERQSVKEVDHVDVRDIVADVASRYDDSEMIVKTDTDAVILADYVRLRQVLDNLFRNARDHSDGRVTITVGETSDGLYVEDTGSGIPDHLVEDIFDVGVSTRSDGGGLGLAIVEDIVEAHGWSIAVVEPAHNERGTRFELTGIEFVER